MAGDSTHLYLASKIRKLLPKKQQDIINKNPNLYFVGAIAPDILLNSIRFRPIAKKLHRRKAIAELAKNSDRNSLPFLYGYITHIEVDEIFHGIVPKDIYSHLYTETSVEKYLKLKAPIGEYLHPEVPASFSRTAGINGKTALKILRRQIWLSKIFIRSRFLYHLMPRIIKPLFHKYVKTLTLPNDVDGLLKKSIENSVREIKKCRQS